MIVRLVLVVIGCALVIGASGLAFAAPPDTPLVLRRHAEIEAEVIRVRDLFDNSGAAGETIIAHAPAPGRRAIFDSDWLERAAHRLDLAWRPASRLERVEVVRLSTVVTGGVIEDAIRQELTQQGYADGFDMSLGERRLTIHIPADQPPSVEVVRLTVDPRTNRFSATIAAPAGDPRAQQQQIVGRIVAVASVPVLAQDLERGAVVGEADIEWVRMPTRKLAGGAVTTADQLVGLQSRRRLSAGAPVRASDLRPPVLVSRNDTVTLFMPPSLCT